MGGYIRTSVGLARSLGSSKQLNNFTTYLSADSVFFSSIADSIVFDYYWYTRVICPRTCPLRRSRLHTSIGSAGRGRATQLTSALLPSTLWTRLALMARCRLVPSTSTESVSLSALSPRGLCIICSAGCPVPTWCEVPERLIASSAWCSSGESDDEERSRGTDRVKGRGEARILSPCKES